MPGYDAHNCIVDIVLLRRVGVLSGGSRLEERVASSFTLGSCNSLAVLGNVAGVE